MSNATITNVNVIKLYKSHFFKIWRANYVIVVINYLMSKEHAIVEAWYGIDKIGDKKKSQLKCWLRIY